MNPIEEIQAIDLTAYRHANKLGWERQKADREAREGLKEASRKATTALRKRASKLIAPHHIDWTDADGLSINHKDWEINAHLFGEIWPANSGPYTKWARGSIKFSITGRDMDEFDDVCRGLKAAVDVLAETLFAEPK
jgi:hypothetical protein